MSNKVGRIVQTQRTTKNATMYKVDILTTDLLTIVETVVCSGLDSGHAPGELVVMVEVQGKLFITGSIGVKMILGQVTNVADDGQMIVALYEDGSTDPLTDTTHVRRASTQSVTAFQEAYGAADLKVNDWVKCYQLKNVWYVNNLDWTTAASEDLSVGREVDFIVDNFDRADSNGLGQYWAADLGKFNLLGNKAIGISAVPNTARSMASTITATSTGVGLEVDTHVTHATDIVAIATESLIARALLYVSPLKTSTKLSIRITQLIPNTARTAPLVTGTDVGYASAPIAAGLGVHFNSGLVPDGSYVSDSITLVNNNIQPVVLAESAPAVSRDAESPINYNINSVALSCNAGGYIESETTNSYIVDYTLTVGLSVPSIPSVSYTVEAGMYTDARITSASGIVAAPMQDVNKVTATILQTNTDSSGADDNNIVSYTGIHLTSNFTSNAAAVATAGAQFVCANQSQETVSGLTVTEFAAIDSIFNKVHDLSQHEYLIPASKQALASSVEVLIVATHTHVDAYVNGKLAIAGAVSTVEPFGLVGLESWLNDSELLAAGSLVGITQFKAWVGNTEPDGSESGHGDIAANGTLTYIDAYHTIDPDTEDVVYDPNA